MRHRIFHIALETTTEPKDVPDDSARDEAPRHPPWRSTKGVRDSQYVAGQTLKKQRERWEICVELAHQLVAKASSSACTRY
jgi:hypothetical protein